MSGFQPRPASRLRLSLGLLGALLCWMAAPVGPGPVALDASVLSPTTSMANDSLRLTLELPDSVEAGQEVPIMVLRLETLEPGGTLTLSDTWDQRNDEGGPVPPGTFAMRGELLAEQETLRTKPRTLTIRPADPAR